MFKQRSVIQILLALALLVSPVVAADVTEGRSSEELRPIIIGLNADMSAADAESGEAIRRGAMVAITEINGTGGVLGRPLALEIRDHRRNPARGVVNTRELANNPEVVAILGGKHTPVILAELETIHRRAIPYLIPWAAGTPLVDNDYHPNFIFRLSVRDELAGQFLIDHSHQRGFRRLGLLLEQTGWGRSNEFALTMASRKSNLFVARTEWFNWGEQDFSAAIQRLSEAGAEAIIFVGNSPDGVNFIKALATAPQPRQLPVVSHWGIAGGDFTEPLGDILQQVDLVFLQTFSFFNPPHPQRAEEFLRGYRQLFPAAAIADLAAPTGMAHAYDLVHLLAKAISQAGEVDRGRVRDELEKLKFHPGLVRDYAPPFTPEYHEALGREDFQMARFVDGVIIPLSVAEPEGR